MSDDDYRFRGPHVVCRALEASLRLEIRMLRKRIRGARALLRRRAKLDFDNGAARLAFDALDLRRRSPRRR